jgi:hypothetical protein
VNRFYRRWLIELLRNLPVADFVDILNEATNGHLRRRELEKQMPAANEEPTP